MKLAVYSQSGEKVSDITLSSAFDIQVSRESVTQYLNYLRSALRFPIANTKDRGAVSGGGRKPYKQKGTGNARAGSTRSPLWVGGGVTFGPSNERNFQIRINAKQKKRVILGILADLIRENKVKVINDMTLDEIKTKIATGILTNLEASGKVSVIVMPSDTNAIMSFRNIAGALVMTPNKLDMINLLSSNMVMISKAALEKFEELYSSKAKSLKLKAEGKEESTPKEEKTEEKVSENE
jgi:large subunit ribosomal protein L4